MDNLNCKMQARARVCEENKLEYEKNDAYWNNFAVKGVSLNDHIGRGEIGEEYQDDVLKDDSP